MIQHTTTRHANEATPFASHSEAGAAVDVLQKRYPKEGWRLRVLTNGLIRVETGSDFVPKWYARVVWE